MQLLEARRLKTPKTRPAEVEHVDHTRRYASEAGYRNEGKRFRLRSAQFQGGGDPAARFLGAGGPDGPERDGTQARSSRQV